MAFLVHWLSGFDMSPAMVLMAARGIFLTAAIVAAIIADFITARVLVGMLGKMVEKTANSWDDVLFQRVYSIDSVILHRFLFCMLQSL